MNPPKGNLVIISLLVVGLLAAVGGFFYYLGSRNTPPSPAPATNTQPPTAAQTPTSPPAPSPLAESIESKNPANPNIKTFTSTNLGISFNFLETQNGEKFSAKAVGNRVYVYNTKYPLQQGQYVEVFDKNSGDGPEATIKKVFLPSYSPADCLVKIVENPVAKQPTPDNFIFELVNTASVS